MEKAVMNVKEFAEYVGIGINRAYDLVNVAEEIGLPVLIFGEKTRRIPKAKLDEWLNSEAAQKALTKVG